jgi:hypothetical protein
MSILTDHRFKTGYFKNLVIQPQEWREAKARATGQLENAMAFFAPIFELSRRQQASGTSTIASPGSPSRCTCGSGAGSSTWSISPPPYSTASAERALDAMTNTSLVPSKYQWSGPSARH